MERDTLIQAFEIYLSKIDTSPNTISSYRSDIKHFVYWYKEKFHVELDVKKVKYYDLSEYQDSLAAQKFRPSSISRRLQSLRRFFKYLTETQSAYESPAIEINIMSLNPKRQPPCLTTSEIHDLLACAERSGQGMGKRNSAMIQLFLNAGIRISELVQLQDQDIELTPNSGYLRVVDSEGIKERIIPLNSTARRALFNYLETLENIQPESHVFISARGTALTPRAVQKIISSLAREAKITRIKVTPHTLRHTFSKKYLTQNPGNLMELSTLLGHGSVTSTAVYAQMAEE